MILTCRHLLVDMAAAITALVLVTTIVLELQRMGIGGLTIHHFLLTPHRKYTLSIIEIKISM